MKVGTVSTSKQHRSHRNQQLPRIHPPSTKSLLKPDLLSSRANLFKQFAGETASVAAKIGRQITIDTGYTGTQSHLHFSNKHAPFEKLREKLDVHRNRKGESTFNLGSKEETYESDNYSDDFKEF